MTVIGTQTNEKILIAVFDDCNTNINNFHRAFTPKNRQKKWLKRAIFVFQ